jgi:hypothetical protein
MRSKGDSLEKYVAAILEPCYKYSRPTIGSGSTPVEKGDISNPYFCIECKNWNTKSFSIDAAVWKKIKLEAAREYKDAVYVSENSEGNRVVTMDLDDWRDLVIELLEYRETYGWIE